MTNLQSAARQILILSVALMGSLTFVGCQTVDKETVLPAAIHARDDLQYYPPVPEDQQSAQMSAHTQDEPQSEGLVQAGHAGPPQAQQTCPKGHCTQRSPACHQFNK